MPAARSARNRADSVARGMRGRPRRISVKLDAPSSNSRTTSSAQRSPNTSRARATAQNCPYPVMVQILNYRSGRVQSMIAPMNDVTTAIGNTPLVRLNRVVPAGCAEIFVKIEGQNPTGSMKDRMARAMIAGAERDGRLRPGDTVVEYTGGSTGASLALVCAARRYRLRIVTSDAFSEEKLVQMAALG